MMSDEEYFSDGSDGTFQDDSMRFDDVEEEDQYLEDTRFDKPVKKAYEVDFKVHSDQQIRSGQQAQFEEISNILGLDIGQAALLLRHFKWQKEKLIEQYMDNPDSINKAVGIRPEAHEDTKITKVKDFVCDICCDDGDSMETFALPCGHRYCVECYRHYLTQKIKEEGESARIQCMGDKCTMAFDASDVQAVVDDDTFTRYKTLLDRTYVDDRESLRWCPAPNCIYAIECGVRQKQLNQVVPTVLCDCGYQFCFGCGLADHLPCPCSLVKKWLKKCEDDSETANWISAHTKECPICVSTIEKNGGCNHMTCRKCRHEFCWVCMGPWSEHGTSWYNCNRFEEKSGIDARDTQAKSRASLERYLHYYNRYANHEQSAKLDKELYTKTEKKMTQLQSTSGMSWIEVQYLDNASKVLQQCRQTLKWTYAFAFYLEKNNLTHIFEDNQKDLEMAVEQLSELFEKPVDQLANLKVEMMDKTAYVSSRRIMLLEDTAKGLAEDRWKFNVELV
ncbi:hypothetical protein BJ508DRAFT_211354 [Ascobolus immersus RN42]|uniref:RBR-type E3 ubiquitin transferase n=1 Tax=Ascobolus immersus RN42 TaxID=1160509 RepID=A0A3N4I1A6_ASCIM|nr:hypothetical protein BJ508DRAFT_211354 [Ascobolus immersus RN42]